MDAASHPDNVGFITCPQLSEVLHGVGIRMSPVEIELLATGTVFTSIVCLCVCQFLSPYGIHRGRKDVALNFNINSFCVHVVVGFASNGKGGVDANEFCEAVSSLLYNLIGEHAARAAEVQARYNGQQASAEFKDSAEDNIQPLMIEICEGIITHDK